MNTLQHFTIESPVGPLGVTVADGRLRSLEFDADANGDADADTDRSGVVTRLRDYFAGDLDATAEIPVDLVGTAFQRSVWHALEAIPPGTTVSYREIAEQIGRPSSSRAVGNAVGSNPVAIVVPCHRVITSAGGLGGFGGGLERKRWLLAHEGVEPPSLLR
jgi:methylated-DNA-[protein]-cysteine S-methyltransferase